jgi:hypothetical protein
MLYETETYRLTQLTDVRGGISSLSWSRQDDRLVFSAFNRGGFDVFAAHEPVSVDAVLARLRRELPAAAVSDSVPLDAPPDTAYEPSARKAPAEAGAESLAVAASPERSLNSERGGPFMLSDSVLRQRPRDYQVRFSPDCVGAGVLGGKGFGFGGSAAVAFDDLLGDQQISLAADVFGGSLDETNALLLYSYLPGRWDWSVGVFHLESYTTSRVTTTGEALTSPRMFSASNFGAVLGVSRPFDRYRRLDLEFTQMFVRHTSPDRDSLGGRVGSGRRYESVSSPAVSLVGDNALWGVTGPVNGTRYHLTYSPSFAWLANGLAYQTITLDARRYWDLTHGYTFAARLLAGRGDGRDGPDFQVGGSSTLRGYADYGIAGTRLAIMNAELRFPFIERLGVVGPMPLGRLDLRGALFGDAGLVWERGDDLRLTRVVDGVRRLDRLLLGFGVGTRTKIAFVVVKLDAAWHTDLASVGGPRWEFSLGPEF